METTSYWLTSTELPKFQNISSDVTVDVAVIGGGMTGISTAYLLKKAGLKVALLERDKIGGVDSTYTTAHLTAVTDERLHKLAKRFGKSGARAAWHAGFAAIDQIHRNVHDENIECDFRWVPNYLTIPLQERTDDDVKNLKKDAKIATEFGYPTEFLESVPLLNIPGVRFGNQALFHPVKYMAALAQKIHGDGSFVFQQSEAEEFKDKSIRCGQYRVKCDWVIIATHSPHAGKESLFSTMLFQSKMAWYNTYVVGAEVEKGRIPDASFYDTSDPYFYLRINPMENADFVIFGGEDHKTGEEEHTEVPFERLTHTFEQIIPNANITHRWSGQVISTIDGLPYIGVIDDKQFVATGFAGNGMTFGTISAIMARDAITGVKNPWTKLFDPNRKKLSATFEYLSENKDYPYYMVRDRLASAEGDSVDSLKMNEGKILKLGGHKVAAYRDENGKVTTCSAVCTHLGCIVNWNEAEKTWDCPCHGSRFKPTGEVMAGPADIPLEKVNAEGQPEKKKKAPAKRKERELAHD